MYCRHINVLNTDGNIEYYYWTIAILIARQRTQHTVPEDGSSFVFATLCSSWCFKGCRRKDYT